VAGGGRAGYFPPASRACMQWLTRRPLGGGPGVGAAKHLSDDVLPAAPAGRGRTAMNCGCLGGPAGGERRISFCAYPSTGLRWVHWAAALLFNNLSNGGAIPCRCPTIKWFAAGHPRAEISPRAEADNAYVEYRVQWILLKLSSWPTTCQTRRRPRNDLVAGAFTATFCPQQLVVREVLQVEPSGLDV